MSILLAIWAISGQIGKNSLIWSSLIWSQHYKNNVKKITLVTDQELGERVSGWELTVTFYGQLDLSLIFANVIFPNAHIVALILKFNFVDCQSSRRRYLVFFVIYQNSTVALPENARPRFTVNFTKEDKSIQKSTSKGLQVYLNPQSFTKRLLLLMWQYTVVAR